MRWTRVSVLALLSFLAACGSKRSGEGGANVSAPIELNSVAAMNAAAAPANSAANAATNAAAAEADTAAVRDVIDRLYAHYENKGPEAARLTPDFNGAWQRAAGTGGLDYDPYCACQDFDGNTFTHAIKDVQLSGDRAHVVVGIKQFGGQGGRTLWYDLLRTPAGWLIDDIDDGSGKSLKAAFRKAQPGEMGVDTGGNVAG